MLMVHWCTGAQSTRDDLPIKTRKKISHRAWHRVTQHVRIVSLTISSTQFQLVSGTNQLISFLAKFGLKILPVVAILLVVRLVIDSSHHILDRKPPLGILLIPNGSDLMVFIETERYLAHNHSIFVFS